MSSIGRPSATIDLNKTTLSAVSLLNEQLEQAELDIDALELRTTDLESRSTVLEDNLGLPSLQEIYDDTNNLIQEQRNATGLNLKVETNETHIFTNAGNISTNTIDIATNTGNISTNTIDIATNTGNITTNTIDIATNTESINTINETIGSDTIDPKTGIFLKLQNLQEGHEIIPNYDYTGVYLILLNDLIDTENDPNITINNSENKHLNEILLDMQKKIDILEKNNDLTRGMLTQTGYGLGSTAIRSMATAPILFNSRSLDALGINEGSIPTFSLLDTSQASIDSFAIEISNWIYSVIPAPIMTIFETITGKTKEEFIQDIIRAQNPQKFIEAEFLSRVKIGINGDLYIKPSDISHPKGIPELAFSYLNASEIITKANNLANIQTIGTGLDLSITHDLSVDLKGNGGLELSGNQIELTYPIFGIGGAITMDEINHIHVKADEITLTFDIVAKHLKISTTYIEEREGEIEVLQGQIDTIKVGVGLEELTAAGSGWFDWLEGGFGSLFSAGSDATLAGGIGYVASQANSANDKADKLLDLITPGSGSYDDNGYFINSGNIGIGYSKNDNIPP